MLSYQYGPKSLSNVSNTLLNQCHEELRQFWRQKGVQTSTSKLYLIKWPVCICSLSHCQKFKSFFAVGFWILLIVETLCWCLRWQLRWKVAAKFAAGRQTNAVCSAQVPAAPATKSLRWRHLVQSYQRRSVTRSSPTAALPLALLRASTPPTQSFPPLCSFSLSWCCVWSLVLCRILMSRSRDGRKSKLSSLAW